MAYLPFQTARIERWSATSGLSLPSKDIERILIAFDWPSVWELVERMSDEGEFIKDMSDQSRSSQPRRVSSLRRNVAFLGLVLVMLWHACTIPSRSKLGSIVFKIPNNLPVNLSSSALLYIYAKLFLAQGKLEWIEVTLFGTILTRKSVDCSLRQTSPEAYRSRSWQGERHNEDVSARVAKAISRLDYTHL